MVMLHLIYHWLFEPMIDTTFRICVMADKKKQRLGIVLKQTSPRFGPPAMWINPVESQLGVAPNIYMHCYNWDVPLTMHEYIMHFVIIIS